MNKHEKFLDFNGKKIYFRDQDGQSWIAIKPICNQLGVSYYQCLKNIQTDMLLERNTKKLNIRVDLKGNGYHVPKDMMCINEKLLYGWILTIRSKSPELLAYQHTCYERLYEQMKGSIVATH